jgi:uncharacterized protein with FMN-binding domain
MKRALLIAGGTVGGLGAVLAITPPQLSTTSSINIAGGTVIGTTGTGSSASASSPSTSSTKAGSTTKPVATKKATSAATHTAGATKSNATQSATAQASATQPSATHSAAVTPVATHSASTSTSTVKDGTFTGPSVNVNYGNVQVQITVVNGRITDAVAIKAPGGRNDRYTNMAVPILKQQTLKAQSANIQGASGASYTSYGWFKSLQGALADAGF